MSGTNCVVSKQLLRNLLSQLIFVSYFTNRNLFAFLRVNHTIPQIMQMDTIFLVRREVSLGKSGTIGF